MTRWTPDKITAQRENLAQLREKYGWVENGDDQLDLIAIGLRVVDPSPEDVERVARGLFAHHERAPGPVRYNCDWGALPTHIRLKFSDQARAALAAIAEGGE